MPEQPGSAYLHIPFCVRKCRYCDFPSQAGREDMIGRYIDAVAAEIRHTGAVMACGGYGLRPLETVYVGGGTPTLAGADRLVRLMDALRETFRVQGDAEVTFEANPGTVTPLDFEQLRAGGFNRVSIGLQAWQPHLLEALGRIHSPTDFVRAVRGAEQAGFDNIGADIMLGLPRQTASDVRETVLRVLDTGVAHVSFYSLQIEEGTPFFDLHASGKLHLPDEETERGMYHETRRLLAENGLVPYEISSAARPGRACRHHLVYWRSHEYFGFGSAAHSFIGGVRRENRRDLDAYLDAIAHCASDSAFPAATDLETIGPDEQMKEVMLLGFRMDDGIDAESFFQRFGVSMDTRFGPELAELLTRGLIVSDRRGVRLTPFGRDIANQVFMAFV